MRVRKIICIEMVMGWCVVAVGMTALIVSTSYVMELIAQHG
jgi:hypothetical protein